MTIEDRLAPYGRPECQICGAPKERSYVDHVRTESIFAGERYQLTCRNHPGHPLHHEAVAEAAGVPEEDNRRALSLTFA
jgi:hypothetical protein